MPRPNIVLILLDDLGWRDLACYGSTFYETPNLDRLAQAGVRFTDAYAACPVCSPTRASVLAGKYPATLGVTDWIDWGGGWHPCRGRLVDAPYVKELSLAETSIATALREGGYQTWHVGKWHLGGPNTCPEKHGFDVNVGGCDWGCPQRGYFSPWGIPALADTDVPAGTYLTDYLTDEAIRLIRTRDRAKPFFLNSWPYAVHTPIQAPRDLVAKYEAKAKRLGLDPQARAAGEFFPFQHKQHERVQRRLVQSHPVYAAMIENLDWNIGRLLAALDEAGLRDNTMVLFTSDNGGLATSEGSPTSNRPLAEGKGWMYEGGIREPLLVRWPGMVRAGRICQVPVTSPDFYPTFLAAAGLPLCPSQHRDGVNLLPLLQSEEAFDRGPLFWHYPHYGNQGGTPGSSVRQGDWKLIEFFEDDRLELYNLREDIAESRNLAGDRPVLCRQLHERLVAWRQSVDARIPAPNPEWKPPAAMAAC